MLSELSKEVIKNHMTMKKIVQKYPRFLVLLSPKKRDDIGFVSSWKVLQSMRNVGDCEKALAYYEREGYSNVVAFSTFAENDSQASEMGLPPNIVAKFWRVVFNTDITEGGVG